MFSPRTRGYFERAQGFGQLDSPTHQAEVGSRERGLYFQLQLRVDEQGSIREMAYYCPRCLASIAVGTCLRETVLNQTTAEAGKLTIEDVLSSLGGLPVQRSYCAWMGVQALRKALRLE